MKIHYIQHVPFETPGSIEQALREKGHLLTATHLYAGQQLPSVKDLDWLIVLGGPMGVYDEKKYLWLAPEKIFIREAIKAGKLVLGICLGAQLVADVLGAKVYKNQHREIGWFNISPTPELSQTILAEALPSKTEVFHWHGDTFDIPAGAIRLASSEACYNQGFILDNRIVGLQFHLETMLESATALVENCRDELDNSRFVQTEQEILSTGQRFAKINKVMKNILAKMEAEYEE